MQNKKSKFGFNISKFKSSERRISDERVDMSVELIKKLMRHNPFIIMDRNDAERKTTNFADSNYYGGYHE
jgi:hypothetical protein